MYNTSKARLRQKLLESDGNLDNVDQHEFSPNSGMNGQRVMENSMMMPPNGGYNIEQDFGMPSGRKGSMSSQSVLNAARFFKRGRDAGEGFDEDHGIDIGNLTNGSNVSFDDISRIRDRGPYFTNSSKSMDTTPFIPTLGPTATSGMKPTKNNIQYRKQMNHQKKLLMNASNRALTMNGPNPMLPQGDPRAMSLGGPQYGFGYSDPRSMSLSQNPAMGGMSSRTMSLNNFAQNGGPRSMSLMNAPNNDPRAFSMRSDGMGPNNPQMGQMAKYPNNQQYHPNAYPRPQVINNAQYPRNNSLSVQNPNYHYSNQSYQPNSMISSDKSIGQYYNNQSQYTGDPRGNPRQQINHNVFPNGTVLSNEVMDKKMTAYPENSSNSNDLQMNIVEEEDINWDENDAVSNNMNPESLHDSQSPTLKKKGSIRVKKLNLFKKQSPTNEMQNEEGEYISNIGSNSTKEKKLPENPQEYHEKVPHQGNGSTAEGSNGDFVTNSVEDSLSINEATSYDELDDLNDDRPNSINLNYHSSPSKAKLNHEGYVESDIYSSAEEFETPAKSFSERSPAYEGSTKKAESQSVHSLNNSSAINTSHSALPFKTINKQSSIKSIIERTAFDKFRQNQVATGESIHQKQTVDPSPSSNIEGSTESFRKPFAQSDVFDSKPSSQYSSHTSKANSLTDSSVASRTGNNVSSEIQELNTVDSGTEPKSNMKDLVSEQEESPFIENNSEKKKDNRFSKRLSIAGKSKNILKRLSLQSRKSSSEGGNAVSSRKSSFSVVHSPVLSQTVTLPMKDTKEKTEAPRIKLTKEELGILNCNTDLMNELKLITEELAASIKREVSSSNRVSPSSSRNEWSDRENHIIEQSKQISELQEKLNKERDLRFICEEQVLLWEEGSMPSPLKLNYEKAEIYKQLLLKNDQVNQLQNKLQELEASKHSTTYQHLLNKYNDLVKENLDLKFKKIPDLEKQIELEKDDKLKSESSRPFNLTTDHSSMYDVNIDQSQEYIEIDTLKNQRDELREAVGTLTATYSRDIKIANDKIKSLEAKLEQSSTLNDMLTKHLDSNHSSKTSSPTNAFRKGSGGKLQGFTIVSPSKKLFDN